MHSDPHKAKFIFIYVSASLFVLLYAWYYYPYVADDSFISFRYSERLLAGSGLTWTDGKPVEGYSNLLWVLLMALLKSITHGELWIIAWVTCFLCAVATLWLLLRIIGRATGYNIPALIVSAGLFAVSAPVAIWINGGLEAPLIMLLLVSAIYFLTQDIPLRNAWLPGILLGLLALTRPDGILFTWSLSLAIVLFHFFSSPAPFTFRKLAGIIKTHFRPLLVLNWIPLAFYGGQLLFRLAYYGEWVPNTARVKISFNWIRLDQGITYVQDMLTPYAPFLAVAIYFAWKAAPKYRAWLIFLPTMVGISSLYLIAIGGDFFPGFRHGLPLVPLLSGLGGLVFMLLVERFRINTPGYAVLAVIILAGLFIQQLNSFSNQQALTERWEWECRGIGETLQKGFEPWQPSIGLAAAGTVPYFTRFPTLDLLGLNDYYLPRHPPKNFGHGRPGHELGDANYFIQQLPDIFLLNGFGDSIPIYFREEVKLYNKEQFKSQYAGVKLLCPFNYSIAIPRWENGWKFNIRSDRPCYPFIRKYSPRIGIRRAPPDTILVPSWFLISCKAADKRSVIQLNASKQLVLTIPPGETFFLPKGSISPFLSEDRLAGCRFIPLTSTDQSLQVSVRQGEIEVFNPGNNYAGLKEIRIVCGSQ